MLLSVCFVIFCHHAFIAGIIFGFMAMFCSVILLVHMLMQSVHELPLFRKEEQVESAQVIYR